MAIDNEALMEQLRAVFYQEAQEGLDIMESGLVAIDSGEPATADAINAIFRAVHSIKGGSGTFGFSQLIDFAHAMETLLDDVRSDKLPLDPPRVDALLRGVDQLRGMLGAAFGEGEPDAAVGKKLLAEIESLLPAAGAPAARVPAAEPEPEPTEGAWHIDFAPYPDMMLTGNDPVYILRELRTLGTCTLKVKFDELPGLVDLDPEQVHMKWVGELHGPATEQPIKEAFAWIEDEAAITITPIETAASSEEATTVDSVESPPIVSAVATPSKASKAAARENSSIRVGIDKVDALINIVGEIVITQSMLGQIEKDFEISRLDKLRDGLAQLARSTRELQESVMRIRMLPISFVFNRFPRMVRDLSKQLGKTVNLVLTGEGTELDKTVLERIADPLVHIVRNSLDHGLESTAGRIAAGKPEVGTIKLDAFHQGGNIHIRITDDGAGLNTKKILEKAVSKGIVEPDADLSKDEVVELLFAPGFSTADKISEVSGRGVGLDVVRRNVKALSGSIDIQSEEGVGTTFTIRLPLTLAILDGQLVKVGDNIYIVPLTSIIESQQARPEALFRMGGSAEVYRLRDEYIPVLRLYETFGVEPESVDIEKGLLMVVEGDGRRACLLVDDLLNQQQVVIKSLETNFQRVDGVSGATILGDGRVALILDVSGVIDLAHGPQALGRRTAA